MNTYNQHYYIYDNDNPVGPFCGHRPVIQECAEYKGYYIFLRAYQITYRWYKDGKIVVNRPYNDLVFTPKPTLDEVINRPPNSENIKIYKDGSIKIIGASFADNYYYGPDITIEKSNVFVEGDYYIAVFYEDDGESKNMNPVFENYGYNEFKSYPIYINNNKEHYDEDDDSSVDTGPSCYCNDH